MLLDPSEMGPGGQSVTVQAFNCRPMGSGRICRLKNMELGGRRGEISPGVASCGCWRANAILSSSGAPLASFAYISIIRGILASDWGPTSPHQPPSGHGKMRARSIVGHPGAAACVFTPICPSNTPTDTPPLRFQPKPDPSVRFPVPKLHITDRQQCRASSELHLTPYTPFPAPFTFANRPSIRRDLDGLDVDLDGMTVVTYCRPRAPTTTGTARRPGPSRTVVTTQRTVNRFTVIDENHVVNADGDYGEYKRLAPGALQETLSRVF